MDDMNKDGLNDFLRARLEDQHPADNGWNVPPDSVFDAAMVTINEKKKKDRRRFIFWLFPIGLAAAIFLLVPNNRGLLEKDSLEGSAEDIVVQPLLPVESIPESIGAERALTHQSVKTGEPKHRSQTTVSRSSSDRPPGSVADKPVAQNENLSGKESGVSVHISQNPAIPTPEQTTEKKFANQDVENTLINTELTWLIYRGEKQLVAPAKAQLPEVAIQAHSDEGVKPSRGGSFFLGVSGYQNLAMLTMKRIQKDADSDLSRYNHAYSGYGVGLNLLYKLPSRWSFNVQAGYQCYVSESLMNGTMLYDKSKETTDTQGELSYSTDINIATPLGDYQYPADFRVSTAQIKDEELLINHTDIHQRIHSIQITGLTRYSPVQTDSWNWHVGMGVSWDYLLQLDSKLETALYHQDNKMFEMEMSPKEMEQSAPSFLSLVLESGMTWHVNPRWGVFVQGQYHVSMTSLRVPRFSGDTGSYLHDVNLGVGVEIKL